MYAVDTKFNLFGEQLVNLRESGRIAAILGTALTFIVGAISVILGIVNSSPEQTGGSLIVRGLVLVGLSVVAGYSSSISVRKPEASSIQLVMVAVLGSVAAFRTFWISAAVLILAAVIVYSSRESDRWR
ncbi:MAG: hypothetical protein HOD62_02490 [Chloroflexi bacterium]|nr:hypothetical protein [Chloroflexota bacterium]